MLKIFPVEIKYEDTNGNIVSLWVKEADLIFENNEEGGTRIIMDVAETNDMVIQKYARPISLDG